MWGSDEVTGFVKKSVVESPCINTDRRQRTELTGEREPSSCFGYEPSPVPAQRTVAGSDRVMGIAMYDDGFEWDRVEIDDRNSDRRCTEIDRSDQRSRR
jgi:hypothetical protein